MYAEYLRRKEGSIFRRAFLLLAQVGAVPIGYPRGCRRKSSMIESGCCNNVIYEGVEKEAFCSGPIIPNPLSFKPLTAPNMLQRNVIQDVIYYRALGRELREIADFLREETRGLLGEGGCLFTELRDAFCTIRIILQSRGGMPSVSMLLYHFAVNVGRAIVTAIREVVGGQAQDNPRGRLF